MVNFTRTKPWTIYTKPGVLITHLSSWKNPSQGQWTSPGRGSVEERAAVDRRVPLWPVFRQGPSSASPLVILNLDFLCSLECAPTTIPCSVVGWLWLLVYSGIRDYFLLKMYRVTRQVEAYILLTSIWGEYPWPAWAVASCSSGPQAGGPSQIHCNRI